MGIADILNAFVALPNLVALTLLSGTVAAAARDFFGKYPRIEDFGR
jgi:Na+/alanine symporter